MAFDERVEAVGVGRIMRADTSAADGVADLLVVLLGLVEVLEGELRPVDAVAVLEV